MGHAARHGPIVWAIVFGSALCAVALQPAAALGQQASISAWEAAEFRVWGFIPYWTPQSQLNGFPADRIYNHVSDVLYFSGVRPTATGSLNYGSTATQHLTTLKNQAAAHGFRLHMSMLETRQAGSTPEQWEADWTSIVSNPTYRANLVSNVTNLLNTYNMKGFNFDWERPNTVEKWANYTQLARELGNVIKPLGMEISVDDYGNTSSLWDDSPLFDAHVYDQLFIMGYHYGASSNSTFANGKLNLTQQGAEKTFKNEQLVLGVGTWAARRVSGQPIKTLKEIVAADPTLPYDALTWTDGGQYTWDIESRKQVREKTQLALDRDMAGMMSWTLHYDAVNERSLHRVMHHYIAFKRGVPDLNLDGRVNAADADTLANNMGTVPGWKGVATAPQFENFYISGNWEKGDRDGNGFVNQQDADWLAGRFMALGVALPDRLAYTGTFENFTDSNGISARWEAVRGTGGQLRETGNYTQHGAGFLSFTGTGAGAGRHSNTAVTIRNQSAAEAFDAINTQERQMRVDLAQSIDLSEHGDTYFTVVVRQNTAPLLASHLSSPNRTLALEFLDSEGQSQFDFTLFGQQQQFAIRHQADAGGQDVFADGFASDATYLLVGKVSSDGVGANQLQASLFADGAAVGKFTDPGFEWMLAAASSADFNPLITRLQFTSQYEANYTLSNVWIGGAHDFFAPTPADFGDFNEDGTVDAADYVVWRLGAGTTYSQSHYDVWRAHFGQSVGGVGAGFSQNLFANSMAVPEAASVVFLLFGLAMVTTLSRRRSKARH